MIAPAAQKTAAGSRRPRPEPVRQVEAEARILARRAEIVRLVLENAKDLALIQESRHFALAKCSGIGEFGERVLSMSAREAVQGASLGAGLKLFPDLGAMVSDGRTTPEAGGVLGLLARRPEAIRADDTWLKDAEDLSAKELRKKVEKRLRDSGEEDRPRAVTLHLKEAEMKDLDRARSLASASEHEPVGPSEAVAVALRHYVKAKDPLEKTPGVRRMAPTDDPNAPKSRTVPAEVVRTVLQRAGAKCRIPYCDHHLLVQKIHSFQRHCDGGSREAHEIDLACNGHHVLQEKGEIRNLGTTESPRFVDDEGRPLDRRRLAQGG